MECQFCKTVLASKYSLQVHQKRVKYCLKIQEQTNSNVINELIECEYCKKKQSKNNFERHKNNCKISFIIQLKSRDDEVLKLKEEISSLKAQLDIYKNLSIDSQQCIKEIAKQPKTSTSTTNNNILNLAPFNMTEFTEKVTYAIDTNMTEAHVLDGQEGVARLVSSCLKTDDGKKLITCTDISRGIWNPKI